MEGTFRALSIGTAIDETSIYWDIRVCTVPGPGMACSARFRTSESNMCSSETCLRLPSIGDICGAGHNQTKCVPLYSVCFDRSVCLTMCLFAVIDWPFQLNLTSNSLLANTVPSLSLQYCKVQCKQTTGTWCSPAQYKLYSFLTWQTKQTYPYDGHISQAIITSVCVSNSLQTRD